MCYAELRANIDVSFRKSNKKEKKVKFFLKNCRSIGLFMRIDRYF
ncbi:hypothetical protein HMPREF1991_02755 [Hoylesella loescheii DSM 19665 = JCM 12249 = ATCC 15930]|uniref:Uncharacterized protein n=1 Tax=Hoylesella loescheii DSM 19665 = JCM 12249 = ATCC 15930 TaxID=1122985 RepID=A0A069QEV9_HOYLO|nr:hypothetical protein HMPREF1991_02755 [Hoylesella loescheii DSM 19665 = JCM 12249 = ATCC 15930]